MSPGPSTISDVDSLRPALYSVVRKLAYWALRIGFRIHIQGIENIPSNGPLMVACNHASNLDPIIIGGVSPRMLHFFAKQELFKVPLLGRLISALGSIPVARGGPDRRAIMRLTHLFENGKAVLVFPEGTRSSTGELQPPKTGVGMLALRVANLQILPVYIQGSFQAWPRHRSFPRFTRLSVNMGKPFRVSDLDVSPATGAIQESVEGSPPEEDGAAEGPSGKKRLYWAVAKGIMERIERVQKDAHTRTQRST